VFEGLRSWWAGRGNPWAGRIPSARGPARTRALEAWFANGRPANDRLAVIIRDEIEDAARSGGALAFVGTATPADDLVDFSGPWALAEIARRHGLNVDSHEVGGACGADSRRGTTLFALTETALRMGFDAKAAKIQSGVEPYPVLARCPAPFIVHVRHEVPEKGFDHYFAIVERVRRSSVSVASYRGSGELTLAEFLEQWSGNLVLLVPKRVERPPPGFRLRTSFDVERVLHASGDCAGFAAQSGFNVVAYDLAEHPAVRLGEGRQLVVITARPKDEETRHRLRLAIALEKGDPLEEALASKPV
jgi:hypothetical protein